MSKTLKHIIVVTCIVCVASLTAQDSDQLPPFFVNINESDLSPEQLSILNTLQDLETTVDFNIGQVSQANIINQL